MTERQKYMKKYNEEYAKTPKGIVKRIYKHQIRNCKSRNHPLPAYTEEELLAWYTSKKEHLDLHQTWVDSGCNSELTPSCDRLDNEKSYTLDNIELVTWHENKNRAYEAIRKGTLNNKGLLNNGHSPIVQYDFSGKKVNEYISINECTRLTGIDHRGISDACKGNRPTYKGYLWCYLKNEQEFKQTLTPKFLEKTRKSYESSIGFLIEITYSDHSTKKFTVKEAAQHLQISAHNVRQIAKGNISNRTPKLPSDVLSLRLVIKDYIESN